MSTPPRDRRTPRPPYTVLPSRRLELSHPSRHRERRGCPPPLRGYGRASFARSRAKDGADDRDRTGDLVLTKDALCQLSYIGLNVFVSQPSLSTVRHVRRKLSLDLLGGLPLATHIVRELRQRLERETGIEPATNSLEGCDSTTELLPPSFTH